MGQHLSREVKQARALGIEILLVHENDPAHGACAFDKLFQTTPEELVSEGLYHKVAVACHPGPHRAVSLALLAKEVGGVKKRSKVAAAIQSTRSAASSVGSGRFTYRRSSKQRSLSNFFAARSRSTTVASTELPTSSV
eukprot:4814175-Prymnesium_polylepis.1